MLHRYRSMYTGVKYKAAVRLASCVPSSLRSTQRSAWKSHKQTAVSKLCALFDDEDSEAEQFAPYWGQQKTDWEDPPDEQDELADIWYEVWRCPRKLQFARSVKCKVANEACMCCREMQVLKT